MYTPIIPRTDKIIPHKNEIKIIMLAQPSTLYPQKNDLDKMYREKIMDEPEIKAPK